MPTYCQNARKDKYGVTLKVINRTIAHELGHGIAGLEHPFPESQVSGSTQNLMDYRDGTELWHFQWDMLQDPARKIFKWWQNEEGAEAYGNKTHWICLKNEVLQQIKKLSDYYYLPNGKIANLKLIKLFTDCFSFQHHWSSKLYDSAFENQDWKWLQPDFLNCVINVIIGALASGELIKSPYFNFLIGTVSNIAQDEVANILGDWFKVKRDRDYYNNNSLDK